MKYVFLIIIFLSLWILGISFNSADKKRIEICEAYLSFLSFSKREIKFSSKTVLEIIDKFKETNEKVFPYFENCSEPVSLTVSENIKKDKLLKDKQKGLFISFFEKFGTSDEENSLSLIDEHKSIFEDYFSKYKEESEKRAGMVIKLSFLLSAGITILLI